MSTSARNWTDGYRHQAQLFEDARREVEYALGKGLQARNIKVHSVTSRVKDLDKLKEKAERKGYDDPLRQATDLVGARVVVRFLSDLPLVEDIIASTFDVVKREDKIAGPSPESFGYMSLHFDARWRDVHVGPRYNDIRAIGFEIQLRTIVMDAWANISHYLAYKGESSIPEELRRDFFALSGLFYVADTHFEMLSDRSRVIEERAESELADGSEDLEMTLENLSAFLASRFPDRKRAGREAVSELANELRQFDIDRIAQLDPLLASAANSLKQQEKKKRGFYTDVGVIRVSLSALNSEYEAFLAEKGRRAMEAARRPESSN